MYQVTMRKRQSIISYTRDLFHYIIISRTINDGDILSDLRKEQLSDWFANQQGLSHVDLDVISADASFRRYFRYDGAGASVVLVDAPPTSEKNREFVAFAIAYAQAGIHVPEVLASDFERGFFLLSDLGDQTLLPLLNANDLSWYPLAVQQLGLVAAVKIPVRHQHDYNADFFRLELSLFSDWFVTQYLDIALTLSEQQSVNDCFTLLVDQAILQPQVTVHRDFHSRNLMVINQQSLAIIDFQDTVRGPLTYDIASLLKDCYFKLSAGLRQQLLAQSHQMFVKLGYCDDDFLQYQQWFDLMGLQRHLKVCGIFSRLYLRDGKAAYLNDLPLVIDYIVEVCQNYPQLEPLAQLFERHIIPKLKLKERQCAL